MLRWCTGLVAVIVLVSLLLTQETRPTGAQISATEPVDLVNGCTNVSLTWPGDTATATVAAAITPSESLQAIWKLDAPTQKFLGFAPNVPQASDLTTIKTLDAVYICTNAAAVLTRPVLGSIAAAPTATPTPVVPVVQLVSASQAAPRGGSAIVTVQAPPGSQCDIQYLPPVGSAPSTTGLGPKIVGPTGTVTWVWTIPGGTVVGKATVLVTCAGAVFNVTMNII